MEKTELATRFDPKDFEERLYDSWEKAGYFTPEADRERPSFSIVIPPPNVTGRLHIGHALVNTLQDILVRWKRMSGFNTLWVPGTDHAGIATQMVVERDLAARGIDRRELGREAFEQEIWKWKEEHGDQIVHQLKRLGVSCDWSRIRFTLDEGLSRAVRRVFVQLFQDDLIYRGLSIVNWCPRCETAISDVEVEYRETNGALYQIRYPSSDGSASLVVATTRPETMLGDTALAVHPDDDRYRHLIGRTARVPLAGREIPIVADPILVDREFGTGVVKVTPSHDKNDYDAGLRNDLPQLKVIDERGRMTAAVPEAFRGMERFEARTAVVRALEEGGSLVESKPYLHSVGHHEKCDTVVEPMVSTQWFVRIEPLAGPAIDAVRKGEIALIPQSWEATYFNWMENIHDWCISRQLWWGHRIPAWYCDACGHLHVAEDAPDGCDSCGSAELRQETDVLDTWFSSSLWPFSTMGWPEKTPDYETFYPTTALVTGWDILFFWVARMIMMGKRFTGQNPFEQVFLHGLVRDEKGQKMSKSKGNVIDPLEVADEFGADAVRFTLAIFAAGRDIPLARNRMQGYSAFATKLWNASRFAMMHVDTTIEDARPIVREDLRPVERWILSRLNSTTQQVNRSLSAFRFDDAANAIYQFFWHEFCDWYIEMAKPVLLERAGDKKTLAQARRVLLEVLDRSLRLLHPFMPFITEEIWLKLGGVEPSIMVASYPVAEEVLEDPGGERLVVMIQQIVTAVRNVRAERGYSPKDRFKLHLQVRDLRNARGIKGSEYLLIELARLDGLEINAGIPDNAHRDQIGGIEIGIELPKKEISAEESARFLKQIEQVEKEIEATRARLADEKFVSKAPAHIVDGARAREAELRQKLEKLRQNLTASPA
ncbi:MAG TPA: valine--tRNA ligase [Thermoanaerobaculia bacterium]|nr:valine--tRNA ligase [Thermoanaerobaculia bacterium]